MLYQICFGEFNTIQKRKLLVGNNWEKRDRKREKRNDIKEMNSVARQEQGYDKQKQDRDKELSIRKKQYKKMEGELLDAFEND
jgi:hypothetical protein|tara:strand:+ start:3064 stop:3312 length:249 start_codon:yes stop_codon:yes gene_type:complete